MFTPQITNHTTDAPSRDICAWLEGYRRTSGFSLQRISFDHSKEWLFDDGILRHRSRRFFTIEGLRVRANFPGSSMVEQPIIRQPEVGILGFLAQHQQGRLHLLVQAKTEPGNVNAVQLAPTFQATLSNYTRAHEGKEPPFLQYFLEAKPEDIIFNSLQSEQGSRFFRKANRNMIVLLPPDQTVEHEQTHLWVPVSDFCKLLQVDNLVNTDSRSVIASAPWGFLAAEQQPFAGEGKTFFRELLRESYSADSAGAETAWEWLLQKRRESQCVVEWVPLENLEQWNIEPDGIRPENGEFEVIQASVEAPDREVSHWDQPLLTNYERGLIGMVCQQRSGILHFLIQAIAEPGTRERVELTTTVHTAAPNADANGQIFYAMVAKTEGKLWWEGTHSEEGGRFYQDENLYRLIEIPESEKLELPPNYRWLTLAEISRLLQRENLFTNEARSLLAALTIWL